MVQVDKLYPNLAWRLETGVDSFCSWTPLTCVFPQRSFQGNTLVVYNIDVNDLDVNVEAGSVGLWMTCC